MDEAFIVSELHALLPGLRLRNPAAPEEVERLARLRLALQLAQGPYKPRIGTPDDVRCFVCDIAAADHDGSSHNFMPQRERKELICQEGFDHDCGLPPGHDGDHVPRGNIADA